VTLLAVWKFEKTNGLHLMRIMSKENQDTHGQNVRFATICVEDDVDYMDTQSHIEDNCFMNEHIEHYLCESGRGALKKQLGIKGQLPLCFLINKDGVIQSRSSMKQDFPQEIDWCIENTGSGDYEADQGAGQGGSSGANNEEHGDLDSRDAACATKYVGRFNVKSGNWAAQGWLDNQQIVYASNYKKYTWVLLNDNNYDIEVFWVSEEGDHVSYGVIAHGDCKEMSSFQYHIWLVKKAGEDEIDLSFVLDKNPPQSGKFYLRTRHLDGDLRLFLKHE